MSHLLFDSVVATGIPTGVPFVAGYVDGLYANVEELQATHPHAYIVTITVTGKPGARVADIETGDLTPVEGAHWAYAELQAKHRPTLYTSESNWQACQDALRALRVSPSSVDWWIASWETVGVAAPKVAPPIPAGAVARQYAANVPNGTSSYDLSVCLDTWPLAPHPAPVEDPFANHHGPVPLAAGSWTSHDGLRHFTVPVNGVYHRD